MDDLDRLAFRVARTVRTIYPHLLERGFTLSDLEERLAPFAETRREMASGGPDGYEQTVLRLLTGERGYLSAEPGLQDACKRALQMPSPTMSIVRTWAGSTLTLRGTALTLGGERMSTGTASVHHSGAIGNTLSVRAEHADTQPFLAPVRATPEQRPSPAEPNTTCACHFCGGALPAGRNLTYCPHCGLNLTVRHCPACSTELERTWRFCVTCGRQAEDGIDDTHLSAELHATAVDASAVNSGGVTASPDVQRHRT